MITSIMRVVLALAPHAPPHAPTRVACPQLAHKMYEQAIPPYRRTSSVPMPVSVNADDRWFQLGELVRQRRVGAAVEEFSRQAKHDPPPALVVVSVLRCAALKGDLRAERQAYKVWADTWRSSHALPPSEVQAVEEGRAVAVTAAGDVATAAYRLQRLTYSDLLPVSHATLLTVAKQITAIAKELAPSSSRRPRRALRRLGGVELTPGCLCCQPTAGGAKARVEAARTIAALASCSKVEAAAIARGEEAALAAELVVAVEEMLERAGATLKMEVGARVQVQQTRGSKWREGVVEATWWRDEEWPWEQLAAPYLVRLDKEDELVPAGIGVEALIRPAVSAA